MRLKLLTNLNTFLLLLVCLALGATLWWSQRALERPFTLMDRYLELSQGFERKVAQNIQAYLASGDALKQKAAQQALDELAAELPQLPESLGQLLGASLDELRQFSGNQLLAAGKLAGDPQGLLLQAERDLLAALDQLGAYADASQNPAAAEYRAPLLQAGLHLTRPRLEPPRVGQTRQERPGDHRDQHVRGREDGERSVHSRADGEPGDHDRELPARREREARTPSTGLRDPRGTSRQVSGEDLRRHRHDRERRGREEEPDDVGRIGRQAEEQEEHRRE